MISPKTAKRAITATIAVAMAAFHLYTGAFGVYGVAIQTGVHLAFAMALILLLFPTPPLTAGPAGRPLALAYDVLVTLASAIPLGWRLANLEYLASGRFEFVTPVTPLELVLGLTFVFAVLDLCRRMTGWALVLITVVFLIYPSVPGLPGVLAHRGYALGNQVEAQFLTLVGIFSIPLTASAEYIALFIIFGAFLERSGLGQFVMDFAVGLVGRFRGGPAKVAVISSALTGTISGSAPANVVTTGLITIPMMKRLGYPPFMAGAIEAAASTGGVLMPPVMGSVAFIMAQYTSVPYIRITLYALFPAMLYFLGIFLTVHWAAVRYDIKGVPREELPSWRETALKRGHLLLPLLLLLYLMREDYSPGYSVTWSIVATVVISWLRKETRMSWRDILKAMENGAKASVMVAIATATAGMIVGVFELTGVGLKFAQSASAMVDSLLLGLIVTMVVSVVLGMGVPPSVSYIVQVAVTIPMLKTFVTASGMASGTATIVSHFFVMYFAALAVLTPPDALAAVAASGIAGSPFLKTAFHGTRVAFVGFIVPFMFVYRPALLTFGTPLQIVTAVILAVLGVTVLSMALEGYALRRLNAIERPLAFVSGVALVFPSVKADLVGFLGLATLLGMQWFFRSKEKPVAGQAA